ncbi:BMP family ABC transporter substrate-binding protein [Hyperthermus butylicus]|uniref:ABC-type transport system, periplasmic component/surface lipoprotein n=1 Tax=Hyperthermus butylicus (strain DSM 5456 / JCM 9403 / PLM1-5) TaxID=415426 RepID=A2BJK9_HYPBU|nr:BMP family ABC transporter substrate-binding protein [Hyperthermus butylicus]ABM80170.1 putative ABC-type transport system, periplasmic component/surface lipoprotein [Hyperthermus butylicus DSM 5456]
MPSRRELLKLLGVGAAGLALGALGASLLGSGTSGTPESSSTAQPATKQFSRSQQGQKLRALWIYVGPVGDVGWTHAHHVGRGRALEALKDFVDTSVQTYVEKIPENQAYTTIKRAIEEYGYQAVFATSFGYMDAIKRLAREYPEVTFYHCSGPWEEFKDLPNVVTYFAEFYQLYYLNGIAAGAVTKTCRVGYVPAFLIPEVVRHINAFALGAVYGAKITGNCDNGRKLEIYVTAPLFQWFDPPKARSYAETLINAYNVDVIAYTEDSTAILETAAEYGVYSFSHYSDMLSYLLSKTKDEKMVERIKRSHLTGQVADWAPIYTYLLAKKVLGIAEKEDIWARLGDFTPIRWRRPIEESTAGKPEGAVYLATLNTEAIPAKALEEIKRLYEEMKELLFEPFTGPIRGYTIDSSGKQVGPVETKVPEGVRWGRNELWSEKTMNWFYEKIITLAK